jgi:hypothetical protein
VDPNPSSFPPLYFDPHNSTNCTSTTYVTISILANYHPLLTVAETQERACSGQEQTRKGGKVMLLYV